MERESTQGLIPLALISKEGRFGFRFEFEDAPLTASVKTLGVRLPGLLAPAGPGLPTFRVIDGHRRLRAAAALGLKKIPAVVLEETLPDRELFLLSLFSNWNQNLSELDRMTAIQKGEQGFGFTEAEILEQVFPPLGLPNDPALLKEYRRAAGLVPSVHRLIFEKAVPFRGAGRLEKFTAGEQEFLAREVFPHVHLTSSQLMLLAEWWGDLKRGRRTSLESLVGPETLARISDPSGPDKRGRGELLFKIVRKERFPRLAQAEEDFRKLQQQMAAAREISLERPEGFEAEGFFLKAQIKNPEGLSRVLKALHASQSKLASYFKKI